MPNKGYWTNSVWTQAAHTRMPNKVYWTNSVRTQAAHTRMPNKRYWTNSVWTQAAHTRMPNKGYWTNSVWTWAAHCPEEMTASHYKSVTTRLTTDWTSPLPLKHGWGVIRKRDGRWDKKPTDVQLLPIACSVTVHPLLNHAGACPGPTLLTSSLPQPVHFLGLNVHMYTPANSIFDGL